MRLSVRQIQMIQDSFAKVKPISKQAAEIFYQKLFEYDPELQRLFKNNMGDQGQKLMQTLAVAIASLNDLEKLIPVLQKLAVKHLDYGVKVEDYTPVGNALIFTLGQGLGESFTQELKQAWVTLLKVVFNVMREAAYPDFDAVSFQNKKRYNHG